jgi:D-methionine transport system permease protein
MFSETLTKLFANGMMTEAIWATVYMTVIATVASYLIGLPLGVILYVTKQKGLAPCKPLNVILGFIINILRSIPFIILTFSLFPLTKLIVGTTMGNGAMIVTLIVGAAPYVA